jgi:hypothetical protein
MADKRGLEVLGVVFAGVTAAVMLVAIIVVQSHVAGRLSLESSTNPLVATALSGALR